MPPNQQTESTEPLGKGVEVRCPDVSLDGDLSVPDGATGLVIFAHGSGSSRFSPRNRYVARQLQEGGLGTLLFDLLTEDEEEVDVRTREYRFNIELLTRRLVGAVDWASDFEATSNLIYGYFGSSTGAAAALKAAARRPDATGAVVSRGGRVDLAEEDLERVEAPSLFIVGGEDHTVLDLNRGALAWMSCETELEIVPGAGHLFEGEGELEQVAGLARDWFVRHLAGRRGSAESVP